MFKLLLLIAAAAFAYWWIVHKPKLVVMPEDEARAILGVPHNADATAIRDAHRRLVTAVHPDKGGSAELTRRINLARDTLLKRTLS